MASTKKESSKAEGTGVSGKLGILESFLKLIEKYGTMEIIKALILMGLLCVGTYIATNMDKIFERVFVEQTEKNEDKNKETHDAALEYRRGIKNDMRCIMLNTLDKTDADRVFVLELHNGNNNTTGLPFIYGEMTYEESVEGVEDIDDDYASMNLSRFDLPYYLEENRVWIGSADDLMEIDKKIAYRMKANGTKYLAIRIINGAYNEIGCIGVSYCDTTDVASKTILNEVLITDAQKVSSLLDARNR